MGCLLSDRACGMDHRYLLSVSWWAACYLIALVPKYPALVLIEGGCGKSEIIIASGVMDLMVRGYILVRFVCAVLLILIFVKQ